MAARDGVFVLEAGDETGRRLAAANLVKVGAASQRQVADAFGVNETTVWRWRRGLDRDGVVGLVDAKRGPKRAWKITDVLAARIVALHAQGHSGRAIARRVDVDESGVRHVLAARRAADTATPGDEPAGSAREAGPTESAAAGGDQGSHDAGASTVAGVRRF